MDIVTIDTETFYSQEYSLSKMPTDAYVHDRRFEVIGLGIKINNGETDWYSGDNWVKFLQGYDFSNAAILCWNTVFDAYILHHKAGLRPKVWLDGMSMFRGVWGSDISASLANAAKWYKLGEKGTEVIAAMGKRRRDFTPAELHQYGDYCINDVELTWQLWQKMAPAFPPLELKLIDLTLRMFIEPELLLDKPGLEGYLTQVQARKQVLLDMVEGNALPDDASEDTQVMWTALRLAFPQGLTKKDLMSNPKFADALQALGVEPPIKLSPTTGKPALAFAKTDQEFLALQEHANPGVQALVAARLGTKSTIEETRLQGLIESADRGPVPIGLNYAGAKTKRWSGGAAGTKLNFQNMPGKSQIKDFIYAPEGMTILGADLSNIELRVGLWLAGEMDKLKALGKGLDLYKDFATKVFDVAYEDVDMEQRFIGKTSNLALIYGVGAAKLQQALIIGAKNFLGLDLDISLDECKRIVAIYRAEHKGVVSCWEQGKGALWSMHADVPATMFHKGLAKVDGQQGIRLPSGLHLRYHNLRQEEKDGQRNWVCDARRGTDKLYGAKVFQQFTQATARCVLAERIPIIHRRYPVKLTIHDANYCLAPEAEAGRGLAWVLKQMTVAPQWMPGIPLDAEGGYGRTLKDCGKAVLKTESGKLIHVPTKKVISR